MAEVSSDATLIIATSWQALKRAEGGDEKTHQHMQLYCHHSLRCLFH